MMCRNIAIGLLVLTITCFIAPHTAAEYVIELPVLAAIRGNNLGVFEMMLMRWDQKPQPDPIELIRYNSRVRLGAGNLESIDRAFAYAVERTTSVRHSGTVSIFGHAYRPTNSDGPSAGAAMAVGFIAMFKGDRLQPRIALTGTLEPHGRIGPGGSAGGISHDSRSYGSNLWPELESERSCNGAQLDRQRSGHDRSGL